MILVIDERLFVDATTRDTDKLALLRLAALREHAVVCQKAQSPHARASDPSPLQAWCDELQGTFRREAKRLLEACRISAGASDRGACRLLISERWESRGDCVLPLGTALRVLAEPLHVLVENGLRDAEFLRRAMAPEWRDALSKWERNGRMRFEHGGGIDEMRNTVEYMVTDEGAHAAWGMPAAAWGLLHFLISDHDGLSPDVPSSSAQKLQRLCEGAEPSVRLHVLRRRRQEHYLPQPAMQAVLKQTLTDDKARTTAMAALEQFFASGDREFGKLPELGSQEFWKGRFWAHRGEAWWRDDWFRDDGVWPEMTDLAETLYRAL